MKRILIIGFIGVLSLLVLTGCSSGYNKSFFDTNYTFTKCKTWVGNEVIEIEIDKWTDYEDGEQLQIIDKKGNVYLVSANNSILINEKEL